MTSAVCHRFVQNAWKKERCSNCFKSKEEHVTLKRETPVTRRPLAPSKSRGIMKSTSAAPARRKRTVSFKPELTQVIGFGGEDWSGTEDDDFDEQSPESSEDDAPSSADEDKDLEKITKSNTEQNANITVATTTDRRRTFTQLMLGQPQKDQDGKKQTLLVSVTPFGADDADRTPPKRISKSVSHIPIAKNKEILAETRPKVILTSYSKNRDSPEPIKTSEKKEISENIPIINSAIVLETPAVLSNKIETKQVNIKKEQTPIADKIIEKELIIDTVISNDTVNIYDDVNDDILIEEKTDESCAIIETVNETSLLKQVEELPVVLENIKCDQIVKTELTVQLSTAPPSPKSEPPIPDLKDQSSTSPSASTESSEESADSLGPAESREQAGEPDGRADPDVSCEPPALPRSPPPPLIAPPPRSSFLHGGTPRPASGCDKPKIPSKPDKVSQMVRKTSLDMSPPIIQSPQPPLLDPSKLPNKRRAPNPPPNTIEDTITPQEIYSNISTTQEQQIIEPRITLLPESDIIITEVYSAPFIAPSNPEPAPRKNISLSNDNLISGSVNEKVEEKRKDKTRSRFSLMKFLRGGSGGKTSEKNKLEDVKEKIAPLPKPRLIIVHPLEFNGSTVEIVAPPPGLEELLPGQYNRGLPPAPPPRNFAEKRSEDLKPPPKSEDIIRKHRQLPPSPTRSPIGDNNNVYANLGEIRSGLVPSKPQRTASMREREALLEQQQLRRKQQEHVYERVAPPRRHSDESNNNCAKDPLRLLKPGSYSGSEPDLEQVYSPCGSYYGSECEISEGGCSRPCRLRSRKGRSIVHRNLEDNYGAVVVANHEALAQVLEHLHLSPSIQPALRGLQSAPVLHWSDFSVLDIPGVTVGRRAFYHALWGAHHITLSVSKEQSSLHKHPAGLGAFSLDPVTEFCDLVAGKFLPGGAQGDPGLVQATIAVLPWTQIDTIQSLGATVKSKSIQSEVNRDACFILLQFVNSLKSLQAHGIEEVPLSLSNFILCHDVDRDTHHRLCLLQGFGEESSRTETEKLGSLCQCATAALEELFENSKLVTLIKTLLEKESAMSLSQVKSILEFSLWGPSDVALGVPIKDRELALQRWLDLERATVLHGLVGTRVQLSVLEECHLLFLVRSSAKMMCEASLLLETNGVSS